MATIPPDCARVLMRYKLGTEDIAEMGFHLQRVHHVGDTTDWPRDVNDIADKVASSWASNVPHTYWPSSVSLDRVDVYHLGTDGKTIDKGTATAAWAGSNANSLPWEVSLCITTYGFDPSSFAALARRKRGRFYLPPMGVNAVDGGGGALSGAAAADIVSGVGGFLGDVKAFDLHDYGEAFTDSMALGVLSRTGSIFTPITHWGFDHRFDAQRRRENKQGAVKTIDTV